MFFRQKESQTSGSRACGSCRLTRLIRLKGRGLRRIAAADLGVSWRKIKWHL